MWGKYDPITELPRDFCAEIGPLQLGVVLVFYFFIYNCHIIYMIIYIILYVCVSFFLSPQALDRIPLVRAIINLIVDFMREHVVKWIIERGGWVSPL